MKTAVKVFLVLSSISAILFLAALAAAIHNDLRGGENQVGLGLAAYTLANLDIFMLIAMYMLYCESIGYLISSARMDPKTKHRIDWRLIALSFHSMSFVLLGGLALNIYVQAAWSKSVALWSLIYYWTISITGTLWSLFIIGIMTIAILCLEDVRSYSRNKKKKLIARKMIQNSICSRDSLENYLKYQQDIGSNNFTVFPIVFMYILQYISRHVSIEDLTKNADQICSHCSEQFKFNELITDMKCCQSSKTHFSCLYRYTRANAGLICCGVTLMERLSIVLAELNETTKKELSSEALV